MNDSCAWLLLSLFQLFPQQTIFFNVLFGSCPSRFGATKRGRTAKAHTMRKMATDGNRRGHKRQGTGGDNSAQEKRDKNGPWTISSAQTSQWDGAKNGRAGRREAEKKVGATTRGSHIQTTKQHKTAQDKGTREKRKKRRREDGEEREGAGHRFVFT
jgi:hypothetical protein